MLCVDLAEENSEEKAKTTSQKQLKQEGSNKRNDLKDDKEGSEVNTDFVKTTVLLQGSPKDNDSRRNSFQFTMKGPEDIFNKCIQV